MNRSAAPAGGRSAHRPRLFMSLRGYERPWLRGDLIAGLTLCAILVPQALAYASIARVSPVVGLYAAPGALLLYAALGSSRVLVVGPMAATAALSAATVADVAGGGDERFAAFTAALALRRGRRGADRGPAAPRVPGGLHQRSRCSRASIIGLALTIIVGQLPEAVRDRGRDRRLLRAGLAPRRRISGDTQGLDAARRHALAGADRRAAAARARRSRLAGGGRSAGSPPSRRSASTCRPSASIASGLPSLGLPDVGLGDARRGWPRAASA